VAGHSQTQPAVEARVDPHIEANLGEKRKKKKKKKNRSHLLTPEEEESTGGDRVRGFWALGAARPKGVADGGLSAVAGETGRRR